LLRRTAAVSTAAAIVIATGVAPIAAQTSASPSGKSKSQPDLFQTPAVGKAAPVKRAKSCSGYGDGFVYVPATDTCVKASGYLSIDAGGGGR
jgi:anthranilate phosphoribosyltransferase